MSEPTKGLYVTAEATERGHIRVEVTSVDYAADQKSQAVVDATYINWLIETDERRREQSAKRAASPDDLMVDLGNLEGTERKFTAILQQLDTVQNEAYESMVEDYLGVLNNIILQGIDPLLAIYAFSQGLAIALGFALRANLPLSIAQTILTQQMKSATAAERMVRIITQPAGHG